MSYLIKPTNIMTGATAPAIISFCERKEDAILDVASRSRLSTSDRWSFEYDVIFIKDKQNKKEKSYERD